MDAHRIPLCNVDKYLRTFFPARPKSDSAYYAFKGTLRIYIRRREMAFREMLPLIKHMHQFPRREIKFDLLPHQTDPLFTGLAQLLNNKQPTWKRWIRTHLSQVRLEPKENPTPWLGHRILLVVKEKHTGPWMKTQYGAPRDFNLDEGAHGEFLAFVGLDNVAGWKLQFGIDYS